MKKIVFALSVAALAMTSCSTVYRTASVRDVTAPVAAAAIADLEVSSEKITYSLMPTREVRKGGLENCVNAAISEALRANGGGDILLETQRAVVQRTGLFNRKVKMVTVTGYPAVYKNFRSADEETVKKALVNGALSGEVSEGKRGDTSIFGIMK